MNAQVNIEDLPEGLKMNEYDEDEGQIDISNDDTDAFQVNDIKNVLCC